VEATVVNSVLVDGVEYDEHAIRVLKGLLGEQIGHRTQNVSDFFKIFNSIQEDKIVLTPELHHRLKQLAGTTLLEAAYILKSLDKIKDVQGDWCEYGVAHGKTSAFLAQVMLREPTTRKLWLYDSFEGLPRPHEKDILLHDIFKKQTINAYEGAISIPERCVLAELESVTPDLKYFRIVKGWITLESLKAQSPDQISFAYLDMDFYQSTYEVLKFLIDRMPKGGIAVIDDYGFFSEGVKTAVSEIGAEYPGAFSFEHPFEDKFVILTRQ
jgi:O-methyltransferase